MDIKTIQETIFFVTGTACGIGQFLDCRTTDVGLAHGLVEANSLAGKIQSKIDSAGFFAVKCMGIPAIGVVIFSTAGFGASLAWLLPMTVIGFVAGVKNYLLLKKSKIAVF